MRKALLAITTAALLASAGGAVAGGGNYIDMDIGDPQPHQEAPHLEDPPSKNVGFEITPEIFEAIGGVGDSEPGPAQPALPGGNLQVGDKPAIIILDDGVGSNGAPGNPGGFSPDGRGATDVLVLRLACAFSPDGLTIRNVGDLAAPAGLKLKWQAKGLRLHGMVRLEGELKVGKAARLGGITATGAACGIITAG